MSKMHKHENFLKLLKLFQNKPYHLTKFLFDNKAFNNNFLQKIEESEKLKNIKPLNDIYFKNINQMNNYYKSLIDDLENLKHKKTKKQLLEELNFKLQKAVETEDYLEAARIKNYIEKTKKK